MLRSRVAIAKPRERYAGMLWSQEALLSPFQWREIDERGEVRQSERIKSEPQPGKMWTLKIGSQATGSLEHN